MPGSCAAASACAAGALGSDRERSPHTTAQTYVPPLPKLLTLVRPLEPIGWTSDSVTKQKLRSCVSIRKFSCFIMLFAPRTALLVPASTFRRAKRPPEAWPLPRTLFTVVSGSVSSSKNLGKTFSTAPISSASGISAPGAWHSMTLTSLSWTCAFWTAWSIARCMLTPLGPVSFVPSPHCLMATDLTMSGPISSAPASLSFSFVSTTPEQPSALTNPVAPTLKTKHLPSTESCRLQQNRLKHAGSIFQQLLSTSANGTSRPVPCSTFRSLYPCHSAAKDDEPSVSNRRLFPSSPRA
mmetsp:Transcript_16056/g.45816  ORF Transcript_16056/g.45816 Transcript_16056/m.45816 type:complete len:296 (+) Transcript_16056:520-1407(+)